ncbi:hypothetical protein [Luteolibacter marinus]|uniref:hypothetical protein n=1 Tax=Luteolibacter marinus TaxID=2776705 RepID=UPI001865B3A4|nr:hypothetical protein [Luteolibacter marinus]
MSPASRGDEKPGSEPAAEISPGLVKAARIAESNARSRPTHYCWRYVKRALLAAKVVDSYPDGVSAKYAGSVLTRDFGFVKLDEVKKPEDAPVGAVLVYGGAGHGHIEFRTEKGYVSDFKTANHSKRPLTGVYVKLEEPEPVDEPALAWNDALGALETEWESLRERWDGRIPGCFPRFQSHRHGSAL